MSEPLQRRLLEWEIGATTAFALRVAAELESGGSGRPREEAVILVRTFLSAALKVSRLLWPYGRRVGDDLGIEEAGELRSQLGLDDGHPLAPLRSLAWLDALRLRARDLSDALDGECRTLHLGEREYRIDELVRSIETVHRRIEAADFGAA